MFMAFVAWWYAPGWGRQVRAVEQRLVRLADMFSIDALVRSLFAPYRQLSAGSVRGSLSVQVRAWADRTVSRFIGAMIRITLLLIGCLAIIVAMLIGILQLLAWPMIPLLPLAGLFLWTSGTELPWSL